MDAMTDSERAYAEHRLAAVTAERDRLAAEAATLREEIDRSVDAKWIYRGPGNGEEIVASWLRSAPHRYGAATEETAPVALLERLINMGIRAARNAALEEAASLIEWYDSETDDATRDAAAADIRALKTPKE